MTTTTATIPTAAPPIAVLTSTVVPAGHEGTRRRTYADLLALWEATPPEPEPTPEEIAERDLAQARKEKRDSRPVILLTTDEADINDQAIAHIAKDENLFQRGGELVQIIRQRTADDGIRRASGSPTIARMPEATLRERLTRKIQFMNIVVTKEGEEDYIPAHPPGWCVRAISERGHWDEIRPLTAVVPSPVLRPDGTVLTTPGYDEKSGLFLATDINVTVSENPSRDDAREAAWTILDIVDDFPFASDEHVAAWLALELTPLCRFAFYGPSPLFLVDANVRGSGKTLLCEIPSIINYGRDIARMSNPSDDDEARKRITSLAIAGDPLVLIDNINGRFGCASLDAALTATVWKDRILGASRMIELPLCVTWCASGNNVLLAADTTRRTLHIRLESPMENPELRTGFKYPNVSSHVSENRPALLSAALTILRGYCAAGRPKHGLPAWGSFESWSALVREAIVWLGLPDPAATRQALAEIADSEGAALRELLESWPRLDPGNIGLSTAEVLERLRADSEHLPSNQDLTEVRSAIVELCPPDKGPLPTVRQLGNRLSHIRGRFVGDRCLDYRTKRAHKRVWLLRYVDPKQVVGVAGGDTGDTGDSSGAPRGFEENETF